MKSISQDNHFEDSFSQNIIEFFKLYHVGQLLRRSNACKKAGVPVLLIFMFAFRMAFASKSLYMEERLNEGSIPFSKDTFYRFMNSCYTNWRRFTAMLCAAIVKETIGSATSAERIKVLIVDDSIFSRGRSKKVELLANVFDHAKKQFTRGFRMLTVCWSDGNTTLPVNHCLLSTGNDKNLIQGASDKIDKRSNGGKQRKLAQMKATQVMLKLLEEARDAGIPATHVLFDSWFCMPAVIIAVKEIGFHVIGMVKKSSKIKFRVNGKMQDVKTIYKNGKKRRGKAIWKLSVEAVAVNGEKETPVRLVYVVNRNKKRDYLVLATTDMSLSEDEIIRNYGKRWGIEVFFKTCKSYLKLGKECRSTSYDAMTAHVSIVFARYMMLAVEQREQVDNRTYGELFILTCEEMADVTLDYAVKLILMEFSKEIANADILDCKELAKIVEHFISNIPSLLKTIKSVHKADIKVAA